MAVQDNTPVVATINTSSVRLRQQLRLALSFMEHFKNNPSYSMVVEGTSLQSVGDALSEFCGSAGLVITKDGEIVEFLFDMPLAETYAHVTRVYKDRIWITMVRQRNLSEHLFQHAQDIDKAPWKPMQYTEIKALKADLASVGLSA